MPAFMKVIRRELPLTRVAGPGREALSHSGLEDPPPWASRPLAARLISFSLLSALSMPRPDDRESWSETSARLLPRWPR